MNSLDIFINFFKQGGAFLYPIAAVFAFGLAIAVERFIFLTRVARGNKRLWAELAPLLQSGNIGKAISGNELEQLRAAKSSKLFKAVEQGSKLSSIGGFIVALYDAARS